MRVLVTTLVTVTVSVTLSETQTVFDMTEAEGLTLGPPLLPVTVTR